MKKLMRDLVVPTISASMSWLIFSRIGATFPEFHERASDNSVRASRFSLKLNI